MSYQLTRRDALTVLGTASVATTAGCSGLLSDSDTGETDAEPGEGGGDTTPMETLLALGEVLYPSDTDVTQSFIETYLMGRVADKDGYRTELKQGVTHLNSVAQEAHAAPFAALERSERVSLIQESELRSGVSLADGTDIQRVNYYLIDELLFAFYASPTGGELVGNENPRGFAGGYGYKMGASR